MRTARRSLVVVLALVIAVVATPAYAGDDSPGLLETLGKTVDSVTAPILPKPKPKAEPAPAVPTGEQSSPKQAVVPTVVKAVGSTLTGVTNTVADTLRSTPLAPVLEPVLGLVAPKASAPEVVAPAVVIPEQDLGGLISSLDLLDASPLTSGESSHLATGAERLALSSSDAAESGDETVETVAQTAHIPGTSTLPDGGTSLTTTWLVLWAGVVAAGALIVRRSRRAELRR